MITEIFNNSRYFYWLVLVYFLSLLSVGYIAEYFYKIAPCSLCYFQRYLMMASALLSAFVVVFNFDKKIFTFFIALVVLSGFVLSGFHIGVEQKWWAMPASCVSKVEITASDPNEILMSLQKQMQNQKIASCDKISWRIFGIPASWLTCAAFLFSFIVMVFRECLFPKK